MYVNLQSVWQSGRPRAPDRGTRMADSASDPGFHDDTADEAGSGPDPASTIGTPRWVKVSAAVALVVVLVVVAMLVTGAGEHGPGRHQGETPQEKSREIPSDGGGDHGPPDGGWPHP